MTRSATTRHRLVLLATTCLAATSLAGCGGGATSAGPTEAQSAPYSCADRDAANPVKVSIVSVPLVSGALLWGGVEHGFFADHGIDLSVKGVSDPAASIAAVQGGSADLAFSTIISTLQAVENGVPLTITSSYSGDRPDSYAKMMAGEKGYEPNSQLMVMPDSGIEGPGDLEGKTVAVIDSGGHSELITRNVIKEAGADPDSVTFTVLGFADTGNALMQGSVDAAIVLTPFNDAVEKAGGVPIAYPSIETFADVSMGVTVASSTWADEHPNTVARFRCAIADSAAWFNDNHDEVRTIAADHLDVDPASLANAPIAWAYAAFPEQGLAEVADKMVEFGFLDSEPDLSAIYKS